MGRKKKIIEYASKEATEYIMDAIRRYPELKERCGILEDTRPALLERCRIHVKSFSPNMEPSEELFVQPELKGKDGETVDFYLEGKEKLYLLERSIRGLEGELKETAEAMFLKKTSREELERVFCISQSTITRRRNEAIRLMALEVDAYMRWKSDLLFA